MIGKPLNNTDDDEGRDWLFLETGAAQRNDMAEIGDDIGTLYDFLRGKPITISDPNAELSSNSRWRDDRFKNRANGV